MSWGKAMWRLYKFLAWVSTAVIIVIIMFWAMALTCNAQSPYFHTSKDDIEKVAKKDRYRVSTEMKIIGETMNIVYYLTKDSVVIRVGYVLDMDKPAWIHYRGE